MGRLAGVLAVLLLSAAALWWWGRPGPLPEVRATLPLEGVLAGDDEGYARAVSPRPFVFPRDHGPHPEFRTEWWYFTGTLEAEGGRPLGYQLTFFRSALTPAPPRRSSEWAASQAWMAHLAVTDGRGTHRAFERFSREALGLAGAGASPFRVWVEDWEASGLPTMRLRARDQGVALDLELDPVRPPVAQGDRGLSRKGRGPGNASHYYSLPRLDTRGTITLDGRDHPVRGLSWMDREWSTSALEEGQPGWDWLSLHLDDGSDLMFYRLRTRDGGVDPLSAGSLVRPDGSVRPLRAGEVAMEPHRTWRSPATGVAWPVRWTVRVPDEGLEVRLEPWLEDQEMDLSFRYWEGAIRARGTRHGRPVRGEGYLELTGYGSGH